MKRDAVLIGVGGTAGAYRSVIGGPDHRLWLTLRRDVCLELALRVNLRRRSNSVAFGAKRTSTKPLTETDL